MNPLPVISGSDCVRALQRAGFSIARQKGSHVTVQRAGNIPITVPLHDPLKRGTLRGIIRDAGLTVVEFRDLLRG